MKLKFFLLVIFFQVFLTSTQAGNDPILCKAIETIARRDFNLPENIAAREKYLRFQTYSSRVRGILNDYLANVKDEDVYLYNITKNKTTSEMKRINEEIVKRKSYDVEKLRRKHAWTKCKTGDKWYMSNHLDLYTRSPVICNGWFIDKPSADGQQVFLALPYVSKGLFHPRTNEDISDGIRVVVCAGPSDEEICGSINLLANYRLNDTPTPYGPFTITDRNEYNSYKKLNFYPELSNPAAMAKDEKEYILNAQQKVGCLAIHSTKEDSSFVINDEVSISTNSRNSKKESDERVRTTTSLTKACNI